MKNYPVVQDHYNQPGLNGFFGNLLKGVASAVGAMVGGVVGAVVVSVAMYGIDRYINGNEDASMTMFGIKLFGPQTRGLGAARILRINPTILEPGNKELEEWVRNKFKPYMLSLAENIKGSANETVLKSSAYRSKINSVITSLSVAATYFESKENVGLGLVSFDDVNYDSSSKSRVIYSFLNLVKEAYILALRKAGIEPSVELQTINVNNYSGKKIEFYDWQGKKSIQIELFVEPGTGVKPTSVTNIEIEDLQEKESVPKIENPKPTKVLNDTIKVKNPTATVETGKTKNASVFGWGLAALIGGALMFKKKNKKK